MKELPKMNTRITLQYTKQFSPSSKLNSFTFQLQKTTSGRTESPKTSNFWLKGIIISNNLFRNALCNRNKCFILDPGLMGLPKRHDP